MIELHKYIPEADMLLALPPEELAEAMFHPGKIEIDQYPYNYRSEIELALTEAWAWFEV